MDNSPIFQEPQKEIKKSRGKAGLIAGFITASSLIPFILIITFSTGLGFGNISSITTVLQILGWIALLSSLAGIVVSSIGMMRKEPNSKGRFAVYILLFLIVIQVRNAFAPIQPDERGIVISAFQPRGYRPEPLEPGLHWILPLVESLQIYSIAPQTYIVSSSSNLGDDSILVRTKDEQRFTISAAVTYSIHPENVIELHLVWQNRYEENVVRPLVRSSIRDTASKYTALEITGPARNTMEQIITEHLSSKFAENNLILIHFEITDIQ